MTRVIRIPGIMSGEPCIKGTRVLAAQLALTLGSESDWREEYPTLPEGSREAIEHWQTVCQMLAELRGVQPGQIIEYTHADMHVVKGYGSFVVLVERADGNTDIIPVIGIAREWRTLDPMEEFDRLMAEGERLREDWEERKRLAALMLSEDDYAAAWEAWQESRPHRSYDLYWDGGYVEPITMKLKHQITARIAQVMEERGLTDADVAKKAKIWVKDIEKIRRGMVRDTEVYDLLWILSRIGQRLYIEPVDDEDGGISFG